MRLVGIKTLAPGDELAVALKTSAGKIILNAGVILTPNLIDKIRQFRIYKLYIKDDRFEDVEYVSSLDTKTKDVAYVVIKNSYESLHKGKGLDEYLIKEIAKNLVEFVRLNKDKGVSTLSIDSVEEYVIEHSLNVALLSAFIGNRMNYNYTQLCDLVAGAIIHDLGRENKRDESPEHVQKGFDVARKCRAMNLHSSIVCYEHHEKYDGTGYPRKLKGTAISEFTRVVQVADYFDNILHNFKDESRVIMPHEAFEYLITAADKELDPEVVKRFGETIIFYPNGCTVVLSNGLKAVVIRQNQYNPQRPVVRIYSSNAVIGEVDLLKSLTISIKSVEVI